MRKMKGMLFIATVLLMSLAVLATPVWACHILEPEPEPMPRPGLGRRGWIKFEGDLLRYKLPDQYSVLIVHLDREPNEQLVAGHKRVHITINGYSKSVYVVKYDYITLYFPRTMLDERDSVTVTSGAVALDYVVYFVN